ncbi:MAG: hypothetical protein E7654_06915 [Ruminococcaceae bacterium]|nr:hypothetical protein [Oscillospiraceae bacterium]
MIRYLLPREGRFYRANLHSHSTDSDGHFTPEELVEGYLDHGYSILAITDHNRFFDRSLLCREDFLVLNAFEYNHADYIPENRTVHLGMIARSPEIREMPELLAFPNCPVGTVDETFTASINENIRRGNEAGFLTVLNHMRWSLDNEADVLAYRGMWAMEVFNHFSEVLGIEEFNLSTYLSKIRQGEHLFGIMADDNHNLVGDRPRSLGNLEPWDFSFGGWIEVKAPELSYAAVIDALEQGNFYGSMGPRFESLYIEDGMLHVTCSPVRCISVACNVRRFNNQWSRNGSFTEAVFPLQEGMDFVVVTLTDNEGRRAVSQAYRL